MYFGSLGFCCVPIESGDTLKASVSEGNRIRRCSKLRVRIAGDDGRRLVRGFPLAAAGIHNEKGRTQQQQDK